MEQFKDNGLYTAEMDGTAFSTKLGGESVHIYIRTEAVCVHFLCFRVEDHIHTCILTELGILLEISWIAGKILGWSELHRIDENTDNHPVILFSGYID